MSDREPPEFIRVAFDNPRVAILVDVEYSGVLEVGGLKITIESHGEPDRARKYAEYVARLVNDNYHANLTICKVSENLAALTPIERLDLNAAHDGLVAYREEAERRFARVDPSYRPVQRDDWIEGLDDRRERVKAQSSLQVER
jgi:hypothetical protein